MNSIEILKHELAEQKSSIESKGGVVCVANTNVSPSEITAGIKTIPVTNFSECTAVESDVLLGKTFYAGNNIKKTGSLVVSSTSESDQNLLNYVLYDKQTETYPNLEIRLPEYTTHIKEFLLYNCKCKADIYMTPGIQTVGEAAFYQSADTTIHDFDKASSLTYVGINSFRGTKGIDLANLPSSLAEIDNYAFSDCAKYCNAIVVPSTLTTVGTYTFHCSTLTPVDSIDLSQSVGLTYGMYFISGIKCLGHLNIPEGTTTLSSYFNQNGSIKDITFPTTFTKLNAGAFNANDTIATEDLITESMTFLRTTPPSITTTSICLRLREKTTNPFKIFVPDESFEAYYAITALNPFRNNLYPISQKP